MQAGVLLSATQLPNCPTHWARAWHVIIAGAHRSATLMLPFRRIPFAMGGVTFALFLLLAPFRSLAVAAGAGRVPGGSSFHARTTSSAGRRHFPERSSAQTSGVASAAASVQGSSSPHAGTADTVSKPADAWNEAAGELATKILQQAASGNALALTWKNLSSLTDEQSSLVRRKLRAQLRAAGAHFATARRADAEVEVTLSENAEGYVWIAEIRAKSAASASGEGGENPVVMVATPRLNPEDLPPAAEPLTIRRTRIYRQSGAVLDLALLADWPAAPAGGPEASAKKTRILVLGAGTVTLLAEAADAGPEDKRAKKWDALQSAPITPARPWPRDQRGRIVLGANNGFAVYLPGTKCAGAVDPALALECHESGDPWPFAAAQAPAEGAGAGGGAEFGAYFEANRNYFSGRVTLEGGMEVALPAFWSIVALPPSVAARAGMPSAPPRSPSPNPESHAPPEQVASTPGGWIVTGLDGRALLLNGNEQAVANTGGWGSQIAAVESGCGGGWQVLATAAGDGNEADTVQAYEIAARKPVPVSAAISFAGPVTELWPLAGGSGVLAISRTLQGDDYEVSRLSLTCGE